MFRFEKLDVWQKAIEFANDIYAITRGFPHEEKFGLTSQIRRAVVSISSNIAEGSGRGTDKDFSHFIEIAYGSLMEVVSQMQIARHQGWLAPTDGDDLYSKSEELARMLSGLRASLLRHVS
jgi:four helix bundle protein